MIKDLLTPEKIEFIKTNPFFAKKLKAYQDVIEENQDKPLPDVPYSYYKLFKTTGDRQMYEAPYFLRRKLLNAYTLNYILYEKESDLEVIQDIIWEICGEFTWALPAHIEPLPIENQAEIANYIDLFSAETGASLAEIYDILKDKFEPRINERILYELNKRIINSFMTTRFLFEDGGNNWTGVCCGSVGMVILYICPEKYPLFRDRLKSPLARYIDTFGENGICEEGLTYWNYGFSNYVYFADMLKEYTKGKEDILHLPKVEKVASFESRAYLKNNYCISFSDGCQSRNFNPGLTHFLVNNFKTAKSIPVEFVSHKPTNFFKDAIRSLVWVDPALIESGDSVNSIISEEYDSKLCWYIKKMPKYAFVAKGGCNEESHNHNDLGSFFIVTENGQQLLDYGAGMYNKNYFRIPARYEENLVCCSRGHNIPVINGVVQQHGGRFKATSTQHSDGKFFVNLDNAYPECGMKTFVREYTVTDNGVTFVDKMTFDGNSNTVDEHFISSAEPIIEGNKATFGEAVMTLPENCEVTYVKEPVKGHDYNYGHYDYIYVTSVKFSCSDRFEEKFVIEIN